MEENSGRSSLDRQRSYEAANGNAAARSPEPSQGSPKVMSPRQGHQKLVFSDPVAFRYLEEDPATIVLERRRRLQCFEIYVVEQWACSRVHPTFLIATYTGDTSHTIMVGVLSVPVDESTWSQRLKVYFSAVSQFHARKMETPLGTLMVTNLSGFPSALTVIAVPDGDVRKHREDFIVNENLKRLGCSGRAGLNIHYPQASTIAKFHQVYRTSESVPLYASVMELVKLCQTTLVLYGKLLPAYADGLLCDITEKAISDWWTDIGTYFYNIEPSDGMLGSTTVAALVGLMLGAYNRLKADGQPVGKDVLDIQAMKRAISAFQRSQRIERTRRLDRQTLDKLHQTTAKVARGEGWNVQKAVKSTVAELSGKGGEMVMGIVGARDKASISEVETLDLDHLAQNVSGAKLRWLWQGKPLKSADVFGRPSDELNGRVFSTDDQGNYLWTSQHRDSIYDGDMIRPTDNAYSHAGESRLGRLRDAVGLGGNAHQHRPAKEEVPVYERPRRASADDARSPELLSRPTDSSDHMLKVAPQRRVVDDSSEKSLLSSPLTLPMKNTARLALRSKLSADNISKSYAYLESARPTMARTMPSETRRSTIANLQAELEADPIYQDFSSEFLFEGPQTRVLRRSQSAFYFQEVPLDNPRANRFNRHLSFSDVESSVLTFGNVVTEHDVADDRKQYEPGQAVKRRKTEVIATLRQTRAILHLQQAAIPYTENLVNNVMRLDDGSREHGEELNTLYHQRLEEYEALRATSTDLVSTEKVTLMEAVRRVELVGAKLDYELNVLESRVKETEDGLADFERDVIEIEARVKQLSQDGHEHVSWFHQLMGLFKK